MSPPHVLDQGFCVAKCFRTSKSIQSTPARKFSVMSPKVRQNSTVIAGRSGPSSDNAKIVHGVGELGSKLPPTPYEIEKGLHQALPLMPPQVAAFLLHVPRNPPAWRYQESEGERAERQALENLGAWTG
jgi:hypothetical protein